MAFTLSPNMALSIPSVGSEPGPNYAIDINNCLTTLDQHDHSPGRGVMITPAGININVDLAINSNNLVGAGSLSFTALSAATSTTQALSVAPGSESPAIQDLWYTDSAGNKVQITSNGQVFATIANIPGESYNPVTGVFTWKQGAGSTTPANFDIGSVTIRPNIAATSNGITISPPAAIASQYTLTLPLLPNSGHGYMNVDSSGNILQTPLDYTTLTDASGAISVLNGDREHAWELNGQFTDLTPISGTSLSQIDSMFLVPYNITITSIWIYLGFNATIGSAVNYSLDNYTYQNALISNVSSNGKIVHQSGSGLVYTDSGSVVPVQAGVTKPNIATANINASTFLSWSLSWDSNAVGVDARMRIFYKQR